MERYVTCPRCKKTISNDPLIDEAAARAGSASRSITCDCGERISYWAITTQLREQRTLRQRIQERWRSFSAPRH
jgi:hypothetical protein